MKKTQCCVATKHVLQCQAESKTELCEGPKIKFKEKEEIHLIIVIFKRNEEVTQTYEDKDS